MTATYRVTTWDLDLAEFTPQKGVYPGPYTLFGLRQALRKLRSMGYDVNRAFAASVLVERVETADQPQRSQGA